MDQVLYYVYKTDEHMQKDAPKLNNIEIFPPKCHQVTELTKDGEVNQDPLASGVEDGCYSSGGKSYGGSSDTLSELDDDDVFPKTQQHIIDPRSNGGHILKICSHWWINFIKDTTIT